MFLSDRWFELCRKLGVINGGELWNVIVLRYTEPGRFYHTLDHLGECFEKFDSLKSQWKKPMAVQLMFFLHDIFYDILRKDNEIRSALFLDRIVFQRDQTRLKIETKKLILLSRHVTPPQPFDADAQLALDIDCSILGELWPVYDRYRRGIYQEARFAGADEPLIKERRKGFITTFLGKSRIFYSTIFRQTHELRAVENITKEYALLDKESLF